MKKSTKKSLKLNRETVRNLADGELANVAGGELRTIPALCVQPTEDCLKLYIPTYK